MITHLSRFIRDSETVMRLSTGRVKTLAVGFVLQFTKRKKSLGAGLDWKTGTAFAWF
jgi:hypothetical protein